jgi:hypothetical protein
VGREGRGRGGPGRGGGPFGPAPATFVQELTRELQLSEGQQAAILAVLREQEARLRQRQDDARAEFTREQDALHDQIAAELTDEQAAAFRAWIAQRLSRPPGR